MFIINIHITKCVKKLAQDMNHDFISTSSLEVVLFNYLCLSKYCRHVLITDWLQRDKWSFPLWKKDWRPSRVHAINALQSLFQTSGSPLGTMPLRYCRELWESLYIFLLLYDTPISVSCTSGWIRGQCGRQEAQGAVWRTPDDHLPWPDLSWN